MLGAVIIREIVTWSRRTAKPTKWYLCPTKTDYPAPPCSLIKDIKLLLVNVEDMDQTVGMRWLVRVFTVCTCDFIGFIVLNSSAGVVSVWFLGIAWWNQSWHFVNIRLDSSILQVQLVIDQHGPYNKPFSKFGFAHTFSENTISDYSYVDAWSSFSSFRKTNELIHFQKPKI